MEEMQKDQASEPRQVDLSPRSATYFKLAVPKLVLAEILGKPHDVEDARHMLRILQNRWHQVLTGIAIVNSNSFSVVAHEITDVKFAPMTEDEINWYVITSEPMDKAGAYAIQGLGARFIEGIRGDYLNVVGLPLRLLYKLAILMPRE